MGKELLRLIIESSGKSNKEFAIAIGVCPGIINKWLSGENKISKNVERYRKRLKELGVSLPETKAEKWDKLDEKIAEFYPEDTNLDYDMENDGLIGIGEAAARAFKYL